VAGVGKATAARTLGNYGAVSPEARARVVAAAQMLGYRPNNLARSMATGITRTIGVIVADISNPFFAGVVRGIADACDVMDYSMIVLSTDEMLSKEQAALGVLMDKQVDAIILASAAHVPRETAHIQEAMNRRIPVVLVDRRIRGRDLGAVVIDNRDAARDAVRQLIGVGHRRIAFAWGPEFHDGPLERAPLLALAAEQLWSQGERLFGYIDALDEAGIGFDPLLVSHCPNNEEATVGMARAMLSLPEPPTALLTTETDAMVGALRAIKECGLSYPDDISVIGFDDSSWASVMDPPLTMIAQPMLKLGWAAAQHALTTIAQDDDEALVQIIPSRLISRGSVAPPRASIGMDADGER